MAQTMATVSVAEARNNFSKIGAAVVETGKPVTVFRNSKPWLIISPATQPDDTAYEHEVNAVLERGQTDLAQGRYVELDEFLARHRDDLHG